MNSCPHDREPWIATVVGQDDRKMRTGTEETIESIRVNKTNLLAITFIWANV